MKFFVYGKLKSDQPKAWLIPFSKSEPHTLNGFRMYMRSTGTAGMKKGNRSDYVVGEIRDAKWANRPILGKLLLLILDLNEGTATNVYQRIAVLRNLTTRKPSHVWTYLYNRSTSGLKVINQWGRINKKELQ